MNSADPQTPTEGDEARQRLIAKFGEEILIDGTTVIPNRVIDCFRAVGMTPTEFAFYVTVSKFQYSGDLPWPAIETIARSMGKSYRTVERYIKRLEHKKLLKVTRGNQNPYGYQTNTYDFSPLYTAINTAISNRNITGKAVKPPVDSPPPDKMSGGDSAKTTKHMTNEVTEVSNEESKQESKLTISSDSNLRRKLQKEGVFGNRDADDSDQSTQSPPPHQNGNARYNAESKNETANPERSTPITKVRPTAQRRARPVLPPYCERIICDFSRDLHNLEQLESNKTRAAKVWEHMSSILDIDEYWFADEMLYWARSQALRAAVTRRNKAGEVNRMPYFFTCLEAEAKVVIAASLRAAGMYEPTKEETMP